eukprot:jgi/Chlat1/32/ChrspC232329S00914
MNHVQKIGSMKVKEVAPYVRAQLEPAKVKPALRDWVKNYHEKHILTGSFTPMRHLLVGLFALSYAVAWPTEYRHMKHAEEERLAKLTGEAPAHH